MSLEMKTEEKMMKTEEKTPLFGMEGGQEAELVKLNDAVTGSTISGKFSYTRYEPEEEDKSASILMKITDDLNGQIISAYLNMPRDWPIVTGINKSFPYYRTTFDLINSVYYLIDETMIIDNHGNPISRINKINMKQFLDFLVSKENVTIEVTEGEKTNTYNSLKVLKIE